MALYHRGGRLSSECKVGKFGSGIERCKSKINQEIGDKLKSVRSCDMAMSIFKFLVK